MKTFIKPSKTYIPVTVIKDYRPEFKAVRVKKQGKDEEWIVRPEEVFTEEQIDAERKAKDDEAVKAKNRPFLECWDKGVHDLRQIAQACGLPVVAAFNKLHALRRRGIIKV